jgi:hypothetical protein
MERRPSHGGKPAQQSDDYDIEPEGSRLHRPKTDQAPSSGSSEAGSPMDSRMQLEFAIEEDIPAELEDFVRLSRLGMFKDAEELFDQTLRDHANLFPVAAEYADFLLEQGTYGKLGEFVVQTERSTWAEDETDLFVLLDAFSETRIYGRLNQALIFARRWHKKHSKSPEEFTEAEIQSLEVCLQIIVLVYSNSNWLREGDTQPPWIISSSILPWAGYEEWCISLSRNNRPWESQRVLRLLLSVIPVVRASDLVDKFIESNDETNSPTALALISGINAYVACLLDHCDGSDTYETRPKYLAMARELNMEAGNHLRLRVGGESLNSHSRPYLENTLNYIKLSEPGLTDFSAGVNVSFDFSRLDTVASDAETQNNYLIQKEALRLLIIAESRIRKLPLVPRPGAPVSQFRFQNPKTAPPVEKIEELFDKLADLTVCVMMDDLGYAEIRHPKYQYYGNSLPSFFEDFGRVPALARRRAQMKLLLALQDKDADLLDAAHTLLREVEKHLPARTFRDQEQVASDFHRPEDAAMSRSVQPRTRSSGKKAGFEPRVETYVSRCVLLSNTGTKNCTLVEVWPQNGQEILLGQPSGIAILQLSRRLRSRHCPPTIERPHTSEDQMSAKYLDDRHWR